MVDLPACAPADQKRETHGNAYGDCAVVCGAGGKWPFIPQQGGGRSTAAQACRLVRLLSWVLYFAVGGLAICWKARCRRCMCKSGSFMSPRFRCFWCWRFRVYCPFFWNAALERLLWLGKPQNKTARRCDWRFLLACGGLVEQFSKARLTWRSGLEALVQPVILGRVFAHAPR